MRGHRLSLVAASDRSWRQPAGGDGLGWRKQPRQRREAPATARRGGSGKRNGSVYERIQHLNASQDQPRARIWRMWAELQRAPTVSVAWGTPEPGEVGGREGSGKACGVPEAKLLRHSWAPTSTNGFVVNTGTNPSLPPLEGNALPVGRVYRPRGAPHTRGPWRQPHL